MTAHAVALRTVTGPEPRNSPEQLLARTALGDEQAFAALYDLLVGPIFGTVLQVLRSRAHAEEVTQEVLLEIWRKAATFDARRGRVQTWALTIAHRRAIDRVRSEQSAINREDRAERLDLRRPYDDVTEATLDQLDRAQVRAALAVLTDLQRESILLAYFQGYTTREVSEKLGVAVGTVKTRMRDGLVRLRDALGVHR
ncbi:RNA polymerase sigma-70 factor, ECF subfamily [Amycolatopsis pretoriensis]|uniref:RNA polymerase sigma-70 factor, ECF subfamily n=1 Tax=Amycolatopsis pretoriensis TaxID=218821 RepID=A0A1H5RE41_9PSEU|nr:ECF RNA polymerase sigma factor SigK [Amycolatopsis pretoriensis]SEF35841.1 RNA polymerase sigma-70 factor, ECF subfamily [Amycolatopsis pretoriensis]